MTGFILHFARWLVWQLGETQGPVVERPANITVFGAE